MAIAPPKNGACSEPVGNPTANRNENRECQHVSCNANSDSDSTDLLRKAHREFAKAYQPSKRTERTVYRQDPGRQVCAAPPSTKSSIPLT